MNRVLFLAGVLSLALIARAAEQPLLKVYIVSKESGKGLHEADFPAFPKLGYIAEKPDLAISQLEGISFGWLPGLPKPDGGHFPPVQDGRSLKLTLTSQDAAALNKVTAAHIGARLLLMLNNEPLVAPEIQTPSLGQSLYFSRLPRAVNVPSVKAKLETLVQKPKQPEATATATAKPSATPTVTPTGSPKATATAKPSATATATPTPKVKI